MIKATVAIRTLLVSGLWLAASSEAALIRVDPTGGGDALTVLQGMGLATAGDTVAVRHGLHIVTDVQVVDGVQLLGGWNDAFTSRTPGASHLYSTGTQILRCTTGQGLATVIDGFELTGASRSAILCHSSSPTITNNDFHGNTAEDGGAVHCEYGASPIIEYNHIHHNSANYGGGIRGHWGSDTSPIIRHNLIEYNTANGAGGGIGVNNGSPLIEHNIVRYNEANNTGGGIHVWHGEGGVVEIRWNLIIYNTVEEGGGIGINGGHPIIEHNTIWGNAAIYGGAVFQSTSMYPDPGTTQLANNILGGSTQGNAVYCLDDFRIVIDCNCVYANAGGTYHNCSGPSDIYQDPWFCDLAAEDFTLRSDSPCAPPGPTGCGLIGAYDVGCGPVAIEVMSWGNIKALYR
jgi:hypothetical protein